jgi:hypothetical protein
VVTVMVLEISVGVAVAQVEKGGKRMRGNFQKQGQESIVCMETASDCAREGRKMELMEARAPR